MDSARARSASHAGDEQSVMYMETDPLVDGITVPTEEQCEKLRRFVDEWCGTIRDVTTEVEGNFTGPWTWTVGDQHMDPLKLVPVSHDAVKAHHLVSAENPAFAAVAKVFSYLASRVSTLKTEAHREFFPMLLMFGERVGSMDMAPEGEVQVLLANAMPKLQLLLAFMDHLRQLGHNILHQLAALYSERHRVYVTFHHVHMHMAFRSLGEVMSLMVTLDELVKQNPSFRGSFGPFKRMLLTVRKEPDRFGVDEIEATQLEHTVMQLEGSLVPPRNFLNFLEDEEMQVDLATPRFLEELQTSCSGLLSETLTRLGTSMERPDDRNAVMGTLALFVLRATLGGQVAPADRKLMKQFLELHKRTPLVPLYINTAVQPTAFLIEWLPENHMGLVPGGRERAAACDRERQDHLDRLEATLDRDVRQLITQTAAWIARIESCLPPRVSLQTILGMRLKLVVQGLYLAHRVNTLVGTLLHLHVALQQPISKADVRSLAQCLELLKAIQAQYARRSSMLSASATHLLFFAQCRLHKMLAPARDQLNADLTTLRSSKSALKSFFSTPKDSEEVKLDALAAATLVMDALGGPATANRRILMHLGIDVLRDTQRLQHDTLHDIEEMVHLMELTVELPTLCDKLCDCSFLYFSRELISASIEDSVSRPDEAHKLPYLVAAFRDAEELMKAGSVPEVVIEAFQLELEGLVDCKLMRPLCTSIENDLRLHIHSARLTGVVTVNPIKTGVRDMARFLQTRPLRLATKTVNIKVRVEDYLNATFHNHTALALHNWKTYGEMRKLAQEKYGVQLAEITLPGQTLEQGLDVLEIMRNIHLFVSRYQYNLHSQVFVERPHLASGRHLNTIGIRHVANSIRTHGMGIMNTAVNFAYQFLAKKINVFSQFLYDDHIRSRLLQEVRWFHDNRNSINNEFPLERAEKFNKSIRILGVGEDGSTFLDQFRRLIAELGNALGFVRMLRLGGMHYCQNATKFVPNLGQVGETSLEEAARKEGLSQGTIEAAKNLDVVLGGLRENSAEGVDYFQVLADVFSNELCTADNAHLQEFHMILPALFLSHVEALMQSKDKLMKRTTSLAASFTDDGLTLGVAYLLQVLNQGKQFDALHLFESAHKHYTEMQKHAAKVAADPLHIDDGEDDTQDSLISKSGDPARGSWRQRNAARAAETASEEELANQKLRIQRFRNFQSEWLLLKFSFSGARVFFVMR